MFGIQVYDQDFIEELVETVDAPEYDQQVEVREEVESVGPPASHEPLVFWGDWQFLPLPVPIEIVQLVELVSAVPEGDAVPAPEEEHPVLQSVVGHGVVSPALGPAVAGLLHLDLLVVQVEQEHLVGVQLPVPAPEDQQETVDVEQHVARESEQLGVLVEESAEVEFL